MYEIQLNEEYSITTKKTKFDTWMIYEFLTNAYWSKGIDFASVKKRIKKSLCFGLFYKEKQIGFARVITDYVSLAYLADVFVLKEHRGKGLGKLLIKNVLCHPDLVDVKTWMLATKDAHGLYEKFGFKILTESNYYMKKKKEE
ncbi:GNAT family N-acetyltransferase [Melioribacteraceae bacterium 4301-Me]|uniref:GNAT family N-acetyltransferase n=1 Tax=Pyranulibacter aquaticus TaxID=3163344 RepID=UPI003596D851